MFVKEMVIKYI